MYIVYIVVAVSSLVLVEVLVCLAVAIADILQDTNSYKSSQVLREKPVLEALLK